MQNFLSREIDARANQTNPRFCSIAYQAGKWISFPFWNATVTDCCNFSLPPESNTLGISLLARSDPAIRGSIIVLFEIR